jgi:energy-coupling factor transport system substrate-specific component
LDCAVIQNVGMSTRHLLLATTCVAVNLVLAKIAAMLALPVFLDSGGTFIGAALLPLPWAVGVGALTSLVGGLALNPFFPFYAGTQIAIALTAWACTRAGWMRKPLGAILTGCLVAVVAVVVSAPVTVLMFGGVTYGSTTALNAVFLATGQSIWKSVVSGSAIIESIDKPAAALLAWTVITRLPKRLHAPARV